MSALVILAIALTAVFATFISQQRSFTVQNRVAEMQQNLRQAVEYMSRDIRMAGYGIPDNVAIPNNIVAAGVTSIRSIYAKDNTTGPDQIYILYRVRHGREPADRPAEYRHDDWHRDRHHGQHTRLCDRTGNLILVTDSTITRGTVPDTAIPAGSALTLGRQRFNAAAAQPCCPRADLSPPLHPPVAKARFVRYYIDSHYRPRPPDADGRPDGGHCPPQPLADDIEDMQLTYGLDTNADGTVEIWAPPGAVTPSQIRQVRLQFIARTRLPEAGWSETRPALGNLPPERRRTGIAAGRTTS